MKQPPFTEEELTAIEQKWLFQFEGAEVCRLIEELRWSREQLREFIHLSRVYFDTEAKPVLLGSSSPIPNVGSVTIPAARRIAETILGTVPEEYRLKGTFGGCDVDVAVPLPATAQQVADAIVAYTDGRLKARVTKEGHLLIPQPESRESLACIVPMPPAALGNGPARSRSLRRAGAPKAQERAGAKHPAFPDCWKFRKRLTFRSIGPKLFP